MWHHNGIKGDNWSSEDHIIVSKRKSTYLLSKNDLNGSVGENNNKNNNNNINNNNVFIFRGLHIKYKHELENAQWLAMQTVPGSRPGRAAVRFVVALNKSHLPSA